MLLMPVGGRKLNALHSACSVPILHTALARLTLWYGDLGNQLRVTLVRIPHS